MTRKLAPAARRQQEHAGNQHNDAAPARRAQRLADEHRRRRRRHQRRRAARDRIDLTEIAGAVALDQRGEIEQVNDNRGDDPRPRRRGRQAEERQTDERHQPGADGDQRGGGERVEPDLDQRIPAGVAESGKQNGEEDEIGHAFIPLPACGERVASRASGEPGEGHSKRSNRGTPPHPPPRYRSASTSPRARGEVPRAAALTLSTPPAPTAWDRRAGIAADAPPRRRAPWRRASPNADRRGSRARAPPCRPCLPPPPPRPARARG